MSHEKLILFLKEEVLDRDLRPCRQKQSRTRLDGEEVHQTLSASSVEIYVSSLMLSGRHSPTHNLRVAPSRTLTVDRPAGYAEEEERDGGGAAPRTIRRSRSRNLPRQVLGGRVGGCRKTLLDGLARRDNEREEEEGPPGAGGILASDIGRPSSSPTRMLLRGESMRGQSCLISSPWR